MPRSMQMLVVALVYSRLGRCNAVLVDLHACLQHRPLRVECGHLSYRLRYRDHVTDAHVGFH